MDSRISVYLLASALTAGCAGCITTQPPKTAPHTINNTPVTPSAPKADDAPPPSKRVDGPKRTPKASTEVAFGKMKEAEADADAYKNQPETQARMRDEARQAYQQALKIDPNCQDAQRNLARLYAKIGDFERAHEIYKKALAKNPKDATLWYDLGMCHNRRKEFSEGARCFNKALELEPENREYLKKLGFTQAWLGQLEQGFATLTRAQGAPMAHYSIARVLVQRERSDLAMQHLRLALRENGQLEVARELLNQLENPNPTPVAALQAPTPVE